MSFMENKANEIHKELTEKMPGEIINKRVLMITYDLTYHIHQNVLIMLKNKGWIDIGKSNIKIPANAQE